MAGPTQHDRPQHDRRAFGRRESCIRAIVYVSGRPPVHAIVRNYSRGGALLELTEAAPTAETLRLVIESQDIDAMCDVRHRNGTSLGVRFLSEVAVEGLAAAHEPAAAAGAKSVAPVKGGDLRRTIFGTGEPEEPVIVRRYTNIGAVLRNP